MGMNIGASYASMGAPSMSSTSVWQQRQQNMGALKSALQSGDLASAQSAFASISANMPNLNPNSPLGQIGQALQTGDISSATQISSSWKSHARGEGRQEKASPGNTVTSSSTSFATALINSLTQTGLISASNALSPSSASALGANTPSAASQTSSVLAPSSLDPAVAQSLSTFMQNLFASLQAQAGAANAPQGSATPSSSEGAAIVTSTAPTSAAQVASQTVNSSTGIATPMNASGTPPSGQVRHGPHGGGHHHYSEGASNSQLSSNLQALITQLSSSSSSTGSVANANSSTSTSTATDALAQLQQSFANLSNASGGANSNTLSAFLQNLSQNLQSMASTGGLVNLSA